MNKPWTKTYGPCVPLEIDADAFPSTVALFESAVAQYADRPAFECFGRTMTYAEVDRPREPSRPGCKQSSASSAATASR